MMWPPPQIHDATLPAAEAQTRKLCAMKVARGIMPFHGVDYKLLDDSSSELQCVAGGSCSAGTEHF